MTKIALLIGVSEYQPGLNPLPAAVKDVEAIKRVLINPEMGGFTPQDVTVLKNPQPQDIRDAIEDLFSDRHKEDLLLFYFSGHGIKDERGKLYFSTSDTTKNNGKLRKSSAVQASYLHDYINYSRSQRQVIILDCCFSGAIATGMSVKDDGSVNLEEQLGGKGRAILTSSSSTQYSFEQEDSELSIYTRYLVEGINTGVADKDGDGQISIDELHEYASSKVREASPAMTPEFYPVKEGHKILLAKSPKDDPKLKYRKEFTNIARENEGNISIANRYYLDELRNNLSLLNDEADEIEFEVLEPYRKLQEKLQRYEQALSEVIQQEYPIGEKNRLGLQRLQRILNLRDEDITSIEEGLVDSKQVEFLQQEAERLKKEREILESQEKIRQQQEKQELQQRIQREQEKVEKQQKSLPKQTQEYREEPPREKRQQYQDKLREKHRLREQTEAERQRKIGLDSNQTHTNVDKNLSSYNSTQPVRTQLSRFIRIWIGIGLGVGIAFCISLIPGFSINLVSYIGFFLAPVLGWYLGFKSKI